jgi:magnesium transporter
MLSGFDASERERVAALRREGRFFWLDVSLSETSRDDLVDALGIPERALQSLAASGDASASRTFHADRESLVFALRCYVESEAPAEEAAYRLRPVEVHVLVTGDYLMTLHEERISLPAVLAPELPEERSKPYVVYAVLEAMLATTSDALAEIERRLDAIGVTWAEEGGGRAPSRATLRATGPRLATMRRRVGAEQAVFARIGVEIGGLRGFDTHEESYFDRLYEQVNRLLASIDAALNAMAMLLDLQLNERAYVVSVVATIFVPLTLLTGFFGMNFGWMVDRIDTPIAFWLLGCIGPVAVALLCWRFLVRRFVTGD